MSAPVDVLAVMDSARNSMGMRLPGELDARRAEMAEARAAVVELIEAASDGMDVPKKEGSDQNGRFYNAKNAARLRAALARIGGAA